MANSTIAGLPLAITIADDDVIPFTDVSDVAEEPTGKTKKITKSNFVVSGGLYGDFVSKTISGGEIALTEGEYFIALTGEGDNEDSLSAIIQTGGGYLREGYPVVLTGKTGLDYNISVVGTGGLKIQRTFTINNEYDNISFIHRGNGNWQERGRASCG